MVASFSQPEIQRRQQLAASRLQDHGTIIVFSGEPISIPGGLDQLYDFQPHPEYYWLTGSRRAGGAIVLHEGHWHHFVRPVTPEEELWEGVTEAVAGQDVADLQQWLRARSCGELTLLGNPPQRWLDRLRGEPAVARARHRLDAARRPKATEEVTVLEAAAAATASGHAALREALRPGISERELQIVLEAATFQAGADCMGYGTIVGIGSNAAVLHFAPGQRRATAEDLVLVDAGGAIAGYTADVTRTWPVSGRFDDRQRAIHDIVLQALRDGSAMCTPGTEWHDVHRTCAATLARGLLDLGLLRGSVQGALESEAIALFLPHGIGHMVGLGVRDVGGHAPDREEGRLCCGARVRVDLPLEEGFVMTVEPGLYFVPALLDDPQRRQRFADQVDWNELESWRSVGGVRLEDNLLVTASQPVNLTAQIPFA